jgi:peptide/nickel transport system substrate-binding protein
MLKKGVLCLAISVLMFGVLVVADTAIPENPGAYVGGTLTIGVSQTFKDLDPRVSNSVYDAYVYGEVFDDLIGLDPDTLKPIPHIAKSWMVSDDGSTSIFYLNEGIKFSNGEDLTAEDVAYTFNWITDPANGSPNASEYEWLKEALVIDKYTVMFVNKPDWTPFCPGLVSESASIVPKDTCEAMGAEAFNLAPIGSGPYKFVEWKPGDHVTLERNENYWLVKPNLDKVIYRPIPTLATMMLELEAGGIDIADNMPAQDVARFQSMTGVDVLQVASLSYFYIAFNCSHAPSNDVRFRKACYMSTDMDAAVFSIFQGLTGVRAYGCTPPALWANDTDYLKNTIALEEDDAAAKALFDQLKTEGVIPANFKTTIYCPLDPRRTQLATILATNLEENGIDAEVQPLDWGPLLDLLYRSEDDPLGAGYEIFIMGWSGGADPHNFIYYLLTTENAVVGTANNFSWYSNPEADALIKEADTTPGCDQATREALYVEAQRKIFAEYPHISGYHYIETRGVSTRVQDFQISPLTWIQLCSPSNNVWVKE